MNSKLVNIWWLRRDLRLTDNTALYGALTSGMQVLPVFIFDTDILDNLEDKADRRVAFIHGQLQKINEELGKLGSGLVVKYGKPAEAWKSILQDWKVDKVFVSHDYEPYGNKRDKQISDLLSDYGTQLVSLKDVVLLEKNEVLKPDGTPYVVFTPYSRKWKEKIALQSPPNYNTRKSYTHFIQIPPQRMPELSELGFRNLDWSIPKPFLNEDLVTHYKANRDYPAANGTSRLSLHLRFGTISIRDVYRFAQPLSETFVNELIWRDFYHHILFQFPYVATDAFKRDYDRIEWVNNEEHFEKWCSGNTGYPLVDAGMRELNQTGFMHNRVRMVVASFLTKHLLIDWRWGEAYFAQKLLDFDLAANVGGWQWAAGCGTDAAPYFRIFNPSSQATKFDPKLDYIRKWVPEVDSLNYARPVVDHTFARNRCLQVYQKALKGNNL